MPRLKLLGLSFVLACVGACADDEHYAEEPVSPDASAEPASPPSASAPSPAGAASADAASAHARKVHYDATLKLEGKEPATTVAEAVALTKAAGGYAELETQDAAVLHVPVAAFMETFAALQKLGKILDKSLTGADVTEAFNDAVLRRQLIDASLNKLEALLAKARSATERLALLNEIGDLRARRQEADAQIAALTQMAKYSKVTLSVAEPARAVAQVTPTRLGAFFWIDQLSPERRLGSLLGQRAPLAVPKDFVELKDDKYWSAESASQASVSATRLANNPRGDTAFWVAALKRRLDGRYAVVAVEAQGPFQVVRLKDLGDASYRYDVGVFAKDDKLVVTEAFYPDAKEAERFSDNVFATLQSFQGEAL